MRVITTNSGRTREHVSSGSSFNKKKEPEEKRLQSAKETYEEPKEETRAQG